MRNSEENKLKSTLASPQVGLNLKDAVDNSMKRVGDNTNAFKDHGVIRAYQDVIRGLFTPEVIAAAQPSIANLQKFSDFERLTMCVVRCYELMDDVLETLKTKHKQVEKNAYTKVTKSVFDRMADSLNGKFYYKLDVFRLIDDIFHEIEDVVKEQKTIKDDLDAAQASNTKAVQLADRERKLKNKKMVECGVTKLADLIRMPLTRLLPKPLGDGKDVFDSTSFEDSLRDNIRRALTYGGSPQDRYVYFYVNDKRKKPFDFFKILFLQVQPDMSLATTQICCFDSSVSQSDKDSVFFSDYKLEVNPSSLLKQSTAPVNNIEVICDDELEYYDITSKLLVTIYYLVFKQFGINGVKTDHYSKFDQLVPKVVLAAEHLFDFLSFIRSGYVGARPSTQTSSNHISLSTVPLGGNPLLQNPSTRYSTHHSLLDIYGAPMGSQPPSSRPLQQNYLSNRSDSTPADAQVGGRLQKLLDASSGVLQRREEEARTRGLLSYTSGGGVSTGNTMYGGNTEDREQQLLRIRQEKEAREAVEREKRQERERRDQMRREQEEADLRERADREKKDRETREAARREREAKEREERDEKDRKAREERETREKELRERREKDERERRERDEKDRAARAEKELKEKEEREKRERELKERLEREDNERRERDAKERLEREERDRVAREEREKKDKEDRERREKLDRERREQEERDKADREAREAADRAEREIKDKQLREQREREQKEREDREAELKAQREADELKRKLEREQEQERLRLEEQAEQERIAEQKRLQQEKAAEEERLRLAKIEADRKQKELEEQEALRKREAEIEQAAVEAQAKKIETKAEDEKDEMDDDFFDDFDIEESGPSKKATPPPKQPEKSPSIEEVPEQKQPAKIVAPKDEEDEFLDDFDDLDDFTGSIGKKSAQNPAKKQETPKPPVVKPEPKKDEFDDFDDFDDFGKDPTPKKEVPAPKAPEPVQENPKQPVQPKKRIAADDEFEFDDEDFDDLLEDEPKPEPKKAETPKPAPVKEQKISEPSKEDSLAAEIPAPAPVQDKSEIKGGIMALKKLASNKSKEQPAEPILAATGENRRRDPRTIKAGDMPLITQFLTQTQPISEDEVQYVMGNTKFDSIVLQTLFNEWIAAKTVFFLELPETEAILVNVLDNKDNQEEYEANIQDLGAQFNQVLAETFADQPDAIESIKYIFAAFQLAQGLEDELIVFGVFDVSSKQVLLGSIAPGMTQAVLRESPIAVAIADCLAQTANFAIFGKELPALTSEQIVVPTISDGLGQFLEESCEDPMLRYIVMSYLVLYEPATDVLDLDGFKASLEIDEYGIEHAARFVLSIRNADQANKLRAQMQETPELTKPMMMAVENLATEKKAELVMKLAEQVIPEDEISKFVAKDVEEILEKKDAGYEKVFAVLEYCPNQDSSISYFICLDDGQPNLLIGSTVSQEPLNSRVIEEIKAALAKGGRKQLEIYAEHPRNQFMKDQLDYLVCTWALQVCDYGLSPLDGFRCVSYNEGSCVNEIMAGLDIGEGEFGAEEGLDPEQAMIQGEGEDSLGREEGKDEQDEFGDIDLDDDDFGAKKAPPDKPTAKQAAATAAAKSKLNYDQDFDMDDFDQDVGKGGGDDNGANFDDLDDLDF